MSIGVYLYTFPPFGNSNLGKLPHGVHMGSGKLEDFLSAPSLVWV